MSMVSVVLFGNIVVVLCKCIQMRRVCETRVAQGPHKESVFKPSQVNLLLLM